MTTEVARIAIDPYGIYSNRSVANSKSIFKEQNLRSGTLLTKELVKLTNIFDNNSILNGLTFNDIYRSNNNRTLNIELDAGRIIQDNIFIDIKETTNVQIDIFSEFAILSTNTIDNYFEVDSDITNQFSNGMTFAIFNSDESSYNHTNWVVADSIYSDGTTKIYTVQNLTSTSSTGTIIKDNFLDNTSNIGNILITLKYLYSANVIENPLEISPVYITSDYKFYPNFSKNSNKIICGVISITKDLDNFIILPEIYKIDDPLMFTFKLYNQEFNVHNITKIFDVVDGAVIL